MAMRKYANRGGNSGVATYESQRGILTVGFLDGSYYEYTNSSAGRYAMSRMRVLAQSGQGLNSYINRSVGQDYAAKY